jgi:two-component system nitrogen regulation response regulator NtrX
MQPIAIANETVPLPVLEDEHLACRSSARLLISARSPGEAEARARRIHGIGCHGDGPFVCADAGDLPIDDRLLRLRCAHLLDSAAGGTLFIDAVHTMPASVQDVFIALMDELAPERDTPQAVRIISGTSVSLLECIAAGRFDESLFYRLNIIHLTQPHAA